MSTAVVNRLLDMDAAGAAPARRTTVLLRLDGPLAPQQVCRLVRRLPRLVAEDGLVVCELTGPPDVGTVDVVARLVLLARRRGCAVRVRGEASAEHAGDDPVLVGLLRLTGLHGPLADALQARGEAEPREQLGVEEVVEVHDLSV